MIKTGGIIVASNPIQNWNDLMNHVIYKDGYSTDYTEFANLDITALESVRDQWWTYLANYLANEENQNELNHAFLRQGDLPSGVTKSVFKYITENIDLPDSDFNTIFNQIVSSQSTTTPKQPDFWNRSMNDLINNVMTSFVNSPTKFPDIDTGNAEKISMEGIRAGNAGKSFTEAPWVENWTNTEGKNYDEVRGIDEDPKALRNDQNIKFTRQGTDYIKLLMPEYNRNVEVEDLNRNFWVIAQALTGISAFLFYKESPFVKTFKGLIDETIKLWENVLYLWLAFALCLQKRHYTTEDIHTEVVYLPVNEFQTDLKYDGFEMQIGSNPNDNDTLQGLIKNRLNEYAARYPENSLCIIPIIRYDNYEKNYFSSVYFPGAYLLDRNLSTHEWSYVKFNNNIFKADMDFAYTGLNSDNQLNKQLSAIGLAFDEYDRICYLENASAVNSAYTEYNGVYPTDSAAVTALENDNNFYRYYGIKSGSVTYYNLIRMIPSGSNICTYNNENQLQFNGFTLNFYDMARIVGTTHKVYNLDNENCKFLTVTWNGYGNATYTPTDITIAPSPVPSTIGTIRSTEPWYVSPFPTSANSHNIRTVRPQQIQTYNGFYMGELLSSNVGYFKSLEEV